MWFLSALIGLFLVSQNDYQVHSIGLKGEVAGLSISITPTFTPTPTPMITEVKVVKKILPEVKEGRLTSLLNEVRQKNGLPKIIEKKEVCEAAATRQAEIQTNFSHEGFLNRISQGGMLGLKYVRIAENIYSGSDSGETATSAWEASSGHLNNMLGDYAYGCGKIGNGVAVYLFIK